ncbi:hypothetical protein Sjap_004873 [Stephania japonica]|uniref:Major facilitator superfamily (MFS) profile domain-containing protein n=1 Tax=Stephania japonica TaxID=461633 RepID=A0AAP0PKM1_9MAGN
MAGDGGGIASSSNKYNPTMLVFLASLVTACGGLMLGYDIGITREVISMPSFLKSFSVLSTNQLTTLFTSSFYLAVLLVQYPASIATSNFGRNFSIIIGATTFVSAAFPSAAATNVASLIYGRLLLGVGAGFVIQEAPLYISEMAPPKDRGILNTLFPFMINIGILLANLVNYSTNKIKGGWGWRLSLGLAAVPAAIVALLECEKESSMLRGTDNILEEYRDLREACINASKANSNNNNKCVLIFQRTFKPQLVIAFLVPIFQHFTGINAIILNALFLFQTRSNEHGIINAAINLLMSFVIGQVFLRYAAKLIHLFYIFAFFVLCMTLFVAYFLPETKGDSIEDMQKEWSQHWFLRRFVLLEGSYHQSTGNTR